MLSTMVSGRTSIQRFGSGEGVSGAVVREPIGGFAGVDVTSGTSVCSGIASGCESAVRLIRPKRSMPARDSVGIGKSCFTSRLMMEVVVTSKMSLTFSVFLCEPTTCKSQVVARHSFAIVLMHDGCWYKFVNIRNNTIDWRSGSPRRPRESWQRQTPTTLPRAFQNWTVIGRRDTGSS